MFLKKLFYSFFIYLVIQSSCIALCFTDKVDFGDSIEEVTSKLKIPDLALPSNKKNVKRLTVPADLICYGDFFENLSLSFIFGENQFAQIVGTLRKNEKNLEKKCKKCENLAGKCQKFENFFQKIMINLGK